jgi:hypothetical protein
MKPAPESSTASVGLGAPTRSDSQTGRRRRRFRALIRGGRTTGRCVRPAPANVHLSLECRDRSGEPDPHLRKGDTASVPVVRAERTLRCSQRHPIADEFDGPSPIGNSHTTERRRSWSCHSSPRRHSADEHTGRSSGRLGAARLDHMKPASESSTASVGLGAPTLRSRTVTQGRRGRPNPEPAGGRADPRRPDDHPVCSSAAPSVKLSAVYSRASGQQRRQHQTTAQTPCRARGCQTQCRKSGQGPSRRLP